ncbi:MAG: leucine-rich repeat protein [Eubacteriales bacterium]|nr:leucine-rich repeat protein [Eubacteriales bacterium]
MEQWEGTLYFAENGGKTEILGAAPEAEELVIPEEIGGRPVTQIGKKCFLNNKRLRSVVVPDSVGEIGSWAFAHCRYLEWVELPRRELTLGREIFIGSGRLEQIRLRSTGRTGGEAFRDVPEGTAQLLAVAAVRLSMPHLLSAAEAGTKEWLRRWDARLAVLMGEDDAEGFERFAPSGVEDAGDTDAERFASRRRREKARLAMTRLLYPAGLEESFAALLEEYLRSHTKGSACEEAWQVLLEECDGKREYYELFARLGCIGADNIDAALQDLGGRHTEMKAWLLRYQAEHFAGQGLLAGLELDF